MEGGRIYTEPRKCDDQNVGIRLGTLAAALGVGFAFIGTASAVNVPKSDIARMKAVYPNLYLPTWLSGGYIYVDWTRTQDPMNKTEGYDGVRVEFAKRGSVVSWGVTGLTGSCARAENSGPSEPFTKLEAQVANWEKATGPNYPQPPGGTGWMRFGKVIAYTTLGNHTQGAWSCFRSAIVTVGFNPGRFADSRIWLRAAASARPAH